MYYWKNPAGKQIVKKKYVIGYRDYQNFLQRIGR
jgi:hypothetical protein